MARINPAILGRAIEEICQDTALRFGSEEREQLHQLAQVLSGAGKSLGTALREQPGLHAIAGHYYARLEYFAGCQEEEHKALFHTLFQSDQATSRQAWKPPGASSQEDAPARVTDKASESRVKGSSQYVQSALWAKRLSYYAATLKSVLDAFASRGRLLEQISNNERLFVRMEGDPE